MKTQILQLLSIKSPTTSATRLCIPKKQSTVYKNTNHYIMTRSDKKGQKQFIISNERCAKQTGVPNKVLDKCNLYTQKYSHIQENQKASFYHQVKHVVILFFFTFS